MLQISEVESLLNETNIKLFNTITDASNLENELIIIGGGSIDDLLKFAVFNEVKTLLYMHRYVSPMAFMISEEEFNNAKVPEEISDDIWGEIDAYNAGVEEYDFDKPFSIIVYCIFESHIFGIIDYDRWYDDVEMHFPEDKLEEIINSYEDEIKSSVEKEKKREEKLKQEFKEIILQDPSFLQCTNKQLRDNYIKSIFEKPEFDRFKPVFALRDGMFYGHGAKLFVEVVWREYKNSLK